MNRPQVPVLVVLCFGILTQPGAADELLTLHVHEANVQIQPREPERQRLDLPPLAITLLASFDCETGSRAKSIVVSVADTHQRFVPVEGELFVQASINVPASQFAPVAIGDFCAVGTSVAESELLIPGIATVQASLHCGTEVSSALQFASAALPLRLVCAGVESQVPSDASGPPDK